MNIETGEIITSESPEFNRLLKQGLIREIHDRDMTERQSQTMQVSKHDNKSKLGKAYRDERRRKKRLKKRNKNRNDEQE